MDVDRLLNLERRTGVKDDDISDFERKVNDVEAAIKGLVAGTLKPEEVKIEGIDTEEEKAQKELQRLERKRALEEKEAKLREERKKEERERWWAGVEIFRPKQEPGNVLINSTTADEELERKAMVLNRYKADYSHWDTWTPNDEASLAEAAELQQREEEARNKEFEKNNADFCSQFVTDMEKRKKATEKKQESADISRLKGNRYFKARAYDKALEFYMEALKDCPFDAKTVNNIAQVYIKTKAFDDAMEFLARTLYLEPVNVKALSRKALILGEQGRVTEAVEVMQAALAVEPGNADLVAQARELGIIAAEKAAELRVQQSTAAAVEAPVAASSPTGGETTPSRAQNVLPSSGHFGALDALRGQVQHASQVLSTSSSTPAAGTATVDVAGDAALYAALASSMRDTLAAASDCQDELKVYARTSGLVDALLTLTKALCSARTRSAELAQLLPVALRLLSALVDGQRASKLLLLEHKLLSALKSVLQECGCGSPAMEVETAECALLVLLVCCTDDISVKTRTAVTSDKQLLGLLAGILGNVSFRVSSVGHTAAAGASVAEVGVIELCARVLKIATFTDAASSALVGLDALAGASVVCGLASAMHMALRASLPTAKSSTAAGRAGVPIGKAALLELLIETALGASQVEALRPHFALATPVSEGPPKKGKEKVAISLSLCAAIVRVIATHPELEVNATAALMNACLEASNAVRRAIVDAGGGDVAMSQLSLSDSERVKEDGVTLVRKAGLLGRLAGEEAVQRMLVLPDRYRQLCRRLTLPALAPSQASHEKWQLDERAHYVRIVASLSAPPAECLSAGVAENVLPALLAVFPTPREDCGEITASSVTLMPVDLAPALVLGNAARCLMPYADVPAYAEQLYGNKKLLGVEKLICAMASCPDMRVRKNIAILLAKGCRVPGVRERMTALRGMQMMVELQNSL